MLKLTIPIAIASIGLIVQIFSFVLQCVVNLPHFLVYNIVKQQEYLIKERRVDEVINLDDFLVNNDLSTIKDDKTRYIKTLIIDYIFLLLKSSTAFEGSYMPMGYFDSRSNIFYSCAEHSLYFYVSNEISFEKLEKEYTSKFEKIVKDFVDENADYLVALNKTEITHHYGDVIDAYINENLETHYRNFKYDINAYGLKDFYNVNNEVALNYIINPERTIDKETNDFVYEKNNQTILGERVAYNKALKDDYDKIYQTKSTVHLKTSWNNVPSYETLEELRTLMHSIKDISAKTIRIYLNEEEPVVISLKSFADAINKAKDTFYINEENHKFDEILKITSGRKVLYQKEV